MTVSDLLGKRHSIARAEQTLKTMKSAAEAGNLRLAVSRGITTIIQATAAAYKAPAPIIRRAEAIVQETRNIIQGAIIHRAALNGLGARFERKLPKRLQKLLEAKQLEEERKKQGIVLTKQEQELELIENIIDENEKGWTSYIDTKSALPPSINAANLISRGQEIVQTTINEASLPDWYRIGRLVTAVGLFKAAESLMDKATAMKAGATYRQPVEKTIAQLKASMTFPRAEGAQEGITIPTPGDPYAVKTRNLLISVFGLSDRAQRQIRPTPDGMEIRDDEAAKEILRDMTLIRTKFPWLQQTMMGISHSA